MRTSLIADPGVGVRRWVLDGSLVRQDPAGQAGAIYPEPAQRMTAGTGSRHSEKNDRSAVNPGADRPGERRLTAEPSEVLIWEMHAGLGPATR
jgi:Pirin